ncbi:hypothetical protein MAUB_15830 [Mycolicibacterium aubagnense]|uniref:Uncharacterized protein n=2 Tax=Mycolicibacterium aubagnense TaxID=319707 RepID=A0ABM7IAP5_9MYCO|nr:hypothetical protein MAUB_15830 [Mycolicibacterium aubagnense]
MVVLATLFAVAVDALLPHREPGLKIRRNSIWYDLLDGSLRPKNAQAVIVAVELKSGGTYYGSIVGYDSEPDQATAWLVLSEHSKIDPPFAFGAIDGTLESIERWQYVFIPFGDIRAMRARFSTEVK